MIPCTKRWLVDGCAPGGSSAARWPSNPGWRWPTPKRLSRFHIPARRHPPQLPTQRNNPPVASSVHSLVLVPLSNAPSDAIVDTTCAPESARVDAVTVFGFPGRRLAESIRGHLERTTAIRQHHVAGLRAPSATASRWPTNLITCHAPSSESNPSEPEGVTVDRSEQLFGQ